MQRHTFGKHERDDFVWEQQDELNRYATTARVEMQSNTNEELIIMPRLNQSNLKPIPYEKTRFGTHFESIVDEFIVRWFFNEQNHPIRYELYCEDEDVYECSDFNFRTKNLICKLNNYIVEPVYCTKIFHNSSTRQVQFF
jgi:hypothetical protein